MFNRTRLNGSRVNGARAGGGGSSNEREPDFRWLVVRPQQFTLAVPASVSTLAVKNDKPK